MLHGSSANAFFITAAVIVMIATSLVQRATAVLLGSSASGIDESLSLDMVASRGSSHHLGYAPVHVTRLHRYDHSGLEAFLEREMAWESSAADASRAANEGPRYLEMSRVQTEELRRHHESWLQDRSREDAILPSVASDAGGSSLEFLAKAETRFGLDAKQAVTGLSSLSSQYVGPMGVGTVFEGCGHEKRNCIGQEESNIWAVFDTGSTNIWVSSDLCKEGACVMQGRKRYNHTRSHTYLTPSTNVQLTVQFGTGKLRGPQGVDDLHIGPFTIHNQTFALIETQNGSVFEHVPFEGIVGLAFPSMSANGVTPFFDNVIKQKVLQHNEFGVYFSPDNPTANAIFWGGVDPRFYEEDIKYFPVVDPYYWAIGLHSFAIGGEVLLGVGGKFNTEAGSYIPDSSNYSSSSSLLSTSVIQLSMQSDSVTKLTRKTKRGPVAILDTGTTYFTAESSLFAQILQRLPPMQCEDISDETHPPITYGLKNAAGTVSELVFTHDMYMVRSSRGDDRCAPAFMRIDIPAAHGPGMVLGETFLRSYFAVFDRGAGGTKEGRVGLARSLHTKPAIDRLRELTSAQPSFMDSRQKLQARAMPP